MKFSKQMFGSDNAYLYGIDGRVTRGKRLMTFLFPLEAQISINPTLCNCYLKFLYEAL